MFPAFRYDKEFFKLFYMSFIPAYFLSTLLDNLKNKVLLKLKNQILNLTDTNHSQQLLIKDQYSSINDSFVIFNISFEVKGKQNE